MNNDFSEKSRQNTQYGSPDTQVRLLASKMDKFKISQQQFVCNFEFDLTAFP